MSDGCTCVLCPECHGNGFHRVEMRGYPEYDLETCDECRGSGFSELCQQCQDADEIDFPRE